MQYFTHIMLGIFLAFTLLAHHTYAHVQMSSPYPLRSPQDPAVIESLKDYDMSSPLMPDGTNFPCKRYQFNQTNPQAYDIKATYSAGSTYKMSLYGSATHSGGSCQISLSYDNGQSFKVIKSIIGGCPLALTYNFTIPSFAPPSSTVLLSWSWFNLVGNREMYQNCARVQINGVATQRYRREPRTYSMKRQSSLGELPDMFACNVGNGCQTVERRQVVFPQPGADVVYGQDATAVEPGPGFVMSGASQSMPPASVATSAKLSSSMATSVAVLTTTSAPSLTTTSNVSFSDNTSPQPTSTTVTIPPFPVDNSTESPGSVLTDSTSFVLPSATFNNSSTISSNTTSTIASTFTTLLTMTSTMTSEADSTTTPPSTTAPFTFPPLPPFTTNSTTTSQTYSSMPPRSTTAPFTFPPLPPFTTQTVPTSTPPAPSASSIPLPCTPGALACNSPTTFSQCVSTSNGGTTYVFFGKVAPGTTCTNGQIVRENAGACSPNGALFCDGESAFFLCDQGGLVRMGPTAPGTVCRDGAIVAAG